MWTVCDLQVWHPTLTHTHTTTKLWEEVRIEKGLLALFTYYQGLLQISRSIAFSVLLGVLLLF